MNVRDDERAQSVVIGSLLVFTILILSFSSYQAFVVPNQNADVEANHFQDVREQFSQFQSNVLNAVGSGEPRSTAIQLGVRYPTRLLALNPPPATGQLETTEAGDVSIVEAGTTMNVCSESGVTPTTRSLVYTPSYNEYRPPEALGYESRVLSREFESGGLYDQRMVFSSSNRIDLFLLTGEVSENGIDTYNLEVNGSSRNTVTLTNPVITIPSRFDANTWNDEILEGQSNVVAADDPTTDRVVLTFSGGDYEVSCAVVGLDGAPDFSPPADDGGDGGGGDPDINPNAPGDIRLNGVSDKSGSTIELDFENLADTDTDVVEARINFYQSQSGGVPTEADFAEVVAGTTGPTAATLTVRGPFEDVTPPITFEGDQVSTVSLDFDQTVNPNDWFVLTMQYDSDEVGQYFISARDEAADSPVGGGGGANSPTFASDPTVTDSSSGGASYSVQYTVDDTGGNFDRVEVEFDCTTCSGNSGDGTGDSTSISDIISFSSNRNGETYEITVEVVDDTGTVTDTYTVTDEADGSGP